MVKEARRRTRRREAEVLVKTNHVARRPITPEEASVLFEAIDAKRISDFGLVKFSTLDVDGMFEAPVRQNERGGPLAEWMPYMTLLSYAALRGRDTIAANLLKAGANPSVRWSSNRKPCVLPTASHDDDRDTDCSSADTGMEQMHSVAKHTACCPEARAHAASLHPAYAVWIVRQVVAMRRRAAFAAAVVDPESNAASPRVCTICGAGGCHGEALSWSPDCAHVVCESCFWMAHIKHVTTSQARVEGTELSCNLCHRENGQKDSSRSLSLTSSATIDQLGTTPSPPLARYLSVIANESVDARLQRAGASAARFYTLPDFLPHKEYKAAANRSFKAASLTEVAALIPGVKKPERTDQFLAAVGNNDALRVRTLVDIGIDVEGTNECGESPLLTAAWLGHTEVLCVLVWAGADVNRASAWGCTPLMAAIARHRTDCISILKVGGAVLGESSIASANALGAGCDPSMVHGHAIARGVPDDANKLATAATTTLVPVDSGHPGAGAFYVDGAFEPSFLARLDALFASLAVASAPEAGTKFGKRTLANTAAERSFFCDAQGWVSAAIEAVVARCAPTQSSASGSQEVADSAHDANKNPVKRCRDDSSVEGSSCITPLAPTTVLSRMRYMNYPEAGGAMMQHTDLAKTDPTTGTQSTHTFILHLADCEKGGETVFLHKLCPKPDEPQEDENILAAASPRRGRLIVFPHICPHAGLVVVNAPKLFVRGELR